MSGEISEHTLQSDYQPRRCARAGINVVNRYGLINRQTGDHSAKPIFLFAIGWFSEIDRRETIRGIRVALFELDRIAVIKRRNRGIRRHVGVASVPPRFSTTHPAHPDPARELSPP